MEYYDESKETLYYSKEFGFYILEFFPEENSYFPIEYRLRVPVQFIFPLPFVKVAIDLPF